MPLLGGHFDLIPDPRRDHGKQHALPDIFGLALCAIVAGADSFLAIEAFGKARLDGLRRFIPLENGVPSHDTIRRVFALIDRRHFERSFAAWAQEAFERTDGRIVAVDGKWLRRARAAGEPMRTVVSAWATEAGAALGQVTTDEGEGEVSAIARLLALLDLSGCIVTIDAAGCQSDIAQQVVDGRGDYVFALKGNQAGLCDDAQGGSSRPRSQGRWTPLRPRSVGTAARRPGATGRPRCRRLRQAGSALAGPSERRDGRGHPDGGRRDDDDAAALCLQPRAGRRGAGAGRARPLGRRERAALEADVSFGEDQSRARAEHAAANLAVARRVALTLLRAETTAEGGAPTKRMRAAWDADYLARVLQLE